MALTWEHQNIDPLLDKFFILRVTIMAASPMINIIMMNGPNSGAAYEPIIITLLESSFTWTLVTLYVSFCHFQYQAKNRVYKIGSKRAFFRYLFAPAK